MAWSIYNIYFRLIEYLSDLVVRLILNVLSCGPVPRHVAFVMDGNRRYARKQGRKVQEGHVDGFGAFHRICDLCLRLEISCVSVYAFSIENFKRPAEEVDALMALAKEKLIEMSQEGELLERHGVRLNVVGKRELLPPDVLEVATRVEKMTEHHSKTILNICMPYTSRDEMTRAVQATVDDCQRGYLDPEDISEDELAKRLEIGARGSPPLDMLVRTSGTARLSDYMLWQASEETQIHFTPTYWPDFGLRDFLPMILAYQRRAFST